MGGRKGFVPEMGEESRLAEVEAVIAAEDEAAARTRCCARCVRGTRAIPGGCGYPHCRCHTIGVKK